MIKKNIKKQASVFIALAAIVAVLFLKAYQVISVDLLMKEMLKLEQTRNGLLDEVQQLQSKVNKLSNIDRISKKAREQYKLVNNYDPAMFIKINDYEDLQKIKKKFARRNKKEETEVNLAGVQ